MSNSQKRTVNYKPRMTDNEAYEQLGPRMRKALQEAAFAWSSYWVLRQVRKHGADKVEQALRAGDVAMFKKGFAAAKGFKGKNGYKPPMPSTVTACKVPALRANW